MSNPQKAFEYFAKVGREKWFEIRNESADEPARIYLYEPIGGWFGTSAQDFVRELQDLDVDEIELHINSPGGAVYDGIAIMNALRHHKASVVAYVDGLAASAASFIAIGGSNELVMSKYSELMIHDAWGLCVGPAADMQKMADDLDRISNNIATIYRDQAGGEVSTWRDAMLGESWYSAQEAVDAGLADRLDETDDDEEEADASNKASKNRWDLSYFDHAGRAHAPSPVMPAAAFDKGAQLPSGVSTVTNRTGSPEPVLQPPAASAAGSTTPVAPAPGDTTTQEGAADVFTDEQLTNLRQKLGVTDADADGQTLLNALDEALEERAANAPAAGSPTVPDGMVLMDSATVESLRADATAGREARNQQQTDRRKQLVQAAIGEGKIPPSRRSHWLAYLERDQEGGEEALAALEPGLVPLDEIGHGDPEGPHAADPADKDMAAMGWGPSGSSEKEA